MNLIDRYLRALRFMLPRDQRDDVLRELREEMTAQMDEQQERLGRSLTSGEEAAIVARYGHPLLTAARYRPQRSLIGPVIFPFYWLLIKVLVSVSLGVTAIAVLVTLDRGDAAEARALIERGVAMTLTLLGWMTLLATLLELWLTKSGALERWAPEAEAERGAIPSERAARAVRHAASAVHHAARVASVPARTRSSLTSTLIGFGLAVALSVWWLLALKNPFLMFGNGAAYFEWGAAMSRLYPVLVAAQLLMLARHFTSVLGFDDRRIRQVTRFAWLAAGWAFIYLVATSDHQWVVWRDATDAAVRARVVAEIAGQRLSILDAVNYSFSIPFVVAALLGVLGSLRLARLALRPGFGARAQ